MRIGDRILASLLMQLRMRGKRSSGIFLGSLVVDDESTMCKLTLARLDRLLRAAKRVADVPFGGVHVVLVGDFLQLPPVGAEPLYRHPISSRHPILMILRNWSAIGPIQSGAGGCQFARRGTWLPEFGGLINARLTTESNALEEWGLRKTMARQTTLPVYRLITCSYRQLPNFFQKESFRYALLLISRES
ncbi:ATP-dependent DNA helicase [Phytophthora megakarya]|uniref:ATP-dependent DNA helicase n=1 Tax=Phytophthora megakarya TaxID=4795 RepID=A0A225VZI4_9STRA|nr:ATP-dependent DNA helicase [Phytophthora megakarya]